MIYLEIEMEDHYTTQFFKGYGHTMEQAQNHNEQVKRAWEPLLTPIEAADHGNRPKRVWVWSASISLDKRRSVRHSDQQNIGPYRHRNRTGSAYGSLLLSLNTSPSFPNQGRDS
jgi:hypothetical protein